MTKKRQEQFEADRQKMLASIGVESDEPTIPLEEEERSQASIDFKNKLGEIAKNSSTLEEMESASLKAFTESCEFEQSLDGKSEKEVENARKLRHNKQIRTKQRKETKGYADGFGAFIEIIDNFQSTFGGGPSFILVILFYLLPISLHWYIKENWLCALIVGFLGIIVMRFATAWLSFVARGLMHVIIAIGPQFICDVREGNPAVKLSVSTANKLYGIASRIHYVVIIGIMCLCFWAYNWNTRVWIDSYFYTMAWCVVIGGCTWFANNLIGYAIYVGFISKILSGTKKVKYRLRYRHDTSRVMIPTRKCNGPFVSKAERIAAFSRDYTGIA